jgi:septal ring factor EnvC (AmiA/AmiB activator)
MMAAKKETKKSTSKSGDNRDTLLKKVDDLGRRIETLEIDIREMAVELMSIDKSLLSGIKTRLGL